MNKVDQKIYSHLSTTFKEIGAKFNRLQTIILPYDVDGKSELFSFDDCTKNTDGIQLLFAYTDDTAKAISMLPKKEVKPVDSV